MELSIRYRLFDLVKYFLKLGAIGFGGPVALVAHMHRDLVEQRNWISEEEYKEGLSLAQLAPGPLAAQLAIYIGFIHFGLIGATLVGFAFIMPSFLMVLALGYLYVVYDGIGWIQAVFYGVGATVMAIIAVSAYKLSIKSLGKNKIYWIIAFLLAINTFITEKESSWLLLAAGGLSWWLSKKRGHTQVLNGIQTLFLFWQQTVQVQENEKLTTIGLFFLKAGAFVFGSGLAIVPFLYGSVVNEYHWLNDQQFLDAVAVAMITPGPVVITVGFIGYLTAGWMGAVVASLATFLPCYLFTVLPAPYFKKYGKKAGIKEFVEGVTAGAIGAIIGAVVVLGKRQFTDFPSIVLALLVLIILIRFKKIPEPVLILLGAGVGLVLKLLFPDL
ncbi:chromate transporter [Flavihumibacter sp. CACIAM 22H1]|uniref:chromate transporter n=1 Tax=Flavihumibacter sp. CACIAM 22H1 TaxID=1812911 RepID=UPI0007A86673|nr:chromate transporter [Flavihumibacter sp. CACIAM 22H1]KYP15494.1 MAG: chromate transporter [Flavihumibacter sp. CACIAM 22H1]